MPQDPRNFPQLPGTAVLVHAGGYLAHDLAMSMPLVCTGTYEGILGDLLWEWTAKALQHAQADLTQPRFRRTE